MKKEAFVEMYSKDPRICNDEAVLSLQRTIMIEEIVSGVNVDNEEKNYEATESVRKMLCRERNQSFDDVINVSIDFKNGIYSALCFNNKFSLVSCLVWFNSYHVILTESYNLKLLGY